MRRNILYQLSLCLVMFYCTSFAYTKSVTCFTISSNTAYSKYSYVNDIFVQKDHLHNINIKGQNTIFTIFNKKIVFDNTASSVLISGLGYNGYLVNTEERELGNPIVKKVECDKISWLKVIRCSNNELEPEKLEKADEANNNAILFTSKDHINNVKQNNIIENKLIKSIGLKISKC